MIGAQHSKSLARRWTAAIAAVPRRSHSPAAPPLHPTLSPEKLTGMITEKETQLAAMFEPGKLAPRASMVAALRKVCLRTWPGSRLPRHGAPLPIRITTSHCRRRSTRCAAVWRRWLRLGWRMKSLRQLQRWTRRRRWQAADPLAGAAAASSPARGCGMPWPLWRRHCQAAPANCPA